MAKFRLRDYIGGSSSPGGWHWVRYRARVLAIQTSLVSRQETDSVRFTHETNFEATPATANRYFSYNGSISIDTESGSRSRVVAMFGIFPFGSVSDLRNGEVQFISTPSGGSIQASNFEYDYPFMYFTVTWSGFPQTTTNVSFLALALATINYVKYTQTRWTDEVQDYWTPTMRKTYTGVQEKSIGGSIDDKWSYTISEQSGTPEGYMQARADIQYNGDENDAPAANSLGLSATFYSTEQSYSYTGTHRTNGSSVRNVSILHMTGGLIAVNAEAIGGNQIQYTAYSSIEADSGITGGQFTLEYESYQYTAGSTNYYWKIKVNGRAYTGRYIRINGVTYDCYDRDI